MTYKKIVGLSVSCLLIAGCSTAPKNTKVMQDQRQHSLQNAVIQPIMPAPHAVMAMPLVERVALPVANTEKYQTIETNTVKSVAVEPISTFSIDVDTGSYSNVRRYLSREGRLPPQDAVRVEELINYFNYSYPYTASQHPLAVHTETVDSPWHKGAKVIRIGLKAKEQQYTTLPPANLVFLIDVSGSMDSEDKLPLVKKTLKILTEQLRPQDKVTLITYANGEKIVLETTSGQEKQKILTAIDQLHAEGATAGERAMQLAYEVAQKNLIKDGINRIFLATDGDFNVGITNFRTLTGMVAEKRKSGISLTTLGFGTGNYNEQLMEQLADAGDGNYSYIDTEKEARKVVQRQLSSTLATVAQDVKIQVEFNPVSVKEYRLIGYENRMLNQADFKNDKVDAGDVGAGHTVTALYEIIPTDVEGWLNPARYQTTVKPTGKANEYAQIQVRYKLPQATQSQQLSYIVKATSRPLQQASRDTQFALAVASYGQQLRGGEYNANMTWQDIISLAQQSAQPDPFGLNTEFVELVKTARNLSSSAK